VRRVLRVGRNGKVQEVAGLPVGRGWEDLDTRVALIQALIPLGLRAVEEVLQREVELLAGRGMRGGRGAGPGAVGPAAGVSLPTGPQGAGPGAPGAGPAGGGRSAPGELPEGCNSRGKRTRGRCGGSCTG